ncbi:MAG: hybrid sensor histidine kinase/response regulator [Methylococcaceae bacterium]
MRALAGKRYAGCLSCLLFFVLFASSGVQAAVLDLPEHLERLTLSHTLEYSVDETGQLDLPAASRDLHYRLSQRDNLTFGFGMPALWVRFSLHNPGTAVQAVHVQIEPERLERVDLFLSDPEGGYRRVENGIRVAIEQRPLPVRSVVFPLSIAAGQTLTLYFRVETRNALSFMPVIWSPTALEKAMQQEDWVVLISIGGVLGLAGYAVLLFPLQRDRSAVFLALAIVLGGIAELSNGGYGNAYLWPNHPDWAVRATIIFFLLATASFNRLVKDFLGLKGTEHKYSAYWLDGFLGVTLILAVLYGSGYSFAVFGSLSILMILASKVFHFGLALASLLRGYSPARYMLLGQMIIGVVTLVRIGESMDWLPFTSLSSEARTAMLSYGSGLCFFAAISQRIDLLKREKEAALIFALDIQRTAAARLEAEVAERTRELSEDKNRAEHADRAKGEFLARVSHELRTPLHTILGYASLLRPDCGHGKAGERLSLLEDGGRHLLRLIEDLLDYARCERDSLILLPEPVFLHRLLMRLDDHGQALATRQANRYIRQHRDGLPVVVGVDQRRLEQAVLILLSNAAAYTHQGTLTLDVRAEPVLPDRTRLYFAVMDSGIGIAAADFGRIFEPFERALGRDTGEGLGLGLAIARQIVRAMGSDIEVVSQPGVGSRFQFSIELPLALEDAIPVELKAFDITGYTGPTRRILLLDDTDAHRSLLEHLLSDLGFEVRGAATLKDARQLMLANTFDLAILDQWLPDGNAYELLPTLTLELPAILVSAMPPAPPPGLEPGLTFKAILLKPVTGEELLDTISRVLDLRWIHDTSEVVSEGPSGDLAELEALAKAGAVYEIEAWIEQARQVDPASADWVMRLEQRFAVLDFEGIAKLAAAKAGQNTADDGIYP